MKCPHCTVTIHSSWDENDVRVGGQHTFWQTQGMKCPACGKYIFRFGQRRILNQKLVDPAEWDLIFPKGSNRGPVPPDVPKDIAADYNEAALVLPLSAKASAALSRRCLQSILRGAGHPQYDLSKQIEAVLAETDTRKALPTGVHTIVDAIRQFGNFAAHKITDKTTLEVIDVESHEAEFCLDILDALFDHYYTRPETAKRQKEILDAKLAAAKKTPTK
jgi:Domain of unknown function (DUF4145)